MVIFLIFTTIVSFYAGILIEISNMKYQEQIAQEIEITKERKINLLSENKKRKRAILSIALLFIFLLLGSMKYVDFFSENLNSLFLHLSIGVTLPIFRLLLPLGISFYTFQSAGYLIDISRGKIKADRNIAIYALFVSFFPQIVQGPISRYSYLAHQLYESHQFDYTRVKFGAQLILWGLFKKMVIADRIVAAVNTIFGNYKQLGGGFVTFIGAALYSFQVYCDFSGGINIAHGVSQIFGISLPENFKRPFFATSIEDFWRRWHITLSEWMRDYVFYPLSLSKSFAKLGRTSRKVFGNGLGKYIPTFIAQFITFLLVGIWHGADWKFVAYGAYNGILICMGILLGPLSNQIIDKLNIDTKNFSWRFYKICGTFFLVSIGRFFSHAESYSKAINMIKWTLFNFNPPIFFDGTLLKLGLDSKDLWLLAICISVMLSSV
jgi:D-alanyl-lipoteichoic acid acyltransferase DltB (MBOAT superfamily)